jgi:hypothetical protein
MITMQDEYRDEKKQTNQKFNDYKEIVEQEIGVKDAIFREYKVRDDKFKEEMGKLKEIILIPRKHFKYMEKLKFDELLDKKKLLDKGQLDTIREHSQSDRLKRNSKMSETTNTTGQRDSVNSLKFPRLHRRSRMKKSSDSAIIGASPTSYRMGAFNTLQDTSIQSAHQNSVEVAMSFRSKSILSVTIDHNSTFDSQIQTSRHDILNQSTNPADSKKSFYSLFMSPYQNKN